MKKLNTLLLVSLLSMPSCKFVNTIDITLHLNGGYLNNQETLKLSLDEFKSLEDYPSKEGYVFTNYYLDEYLLNEFDNAKEITNDIDLYASYVENIFDYELVNNEYHINDIYEGDYNEVIVPEYLLTKRVTTLNTNSFANVTINTLNIKHIENVKIDTFNNSSIHYLKFGETIKNIEYGAFKEMILLKNVTMDFNDYYSVLNGAILEKNEGNKRTIIGTYGDDKTMFNESYFDTVDIIGIAPYAISNISVYDESLTKKGYSFYIPSTMTKVSDYAFNNSKVYAYNKNERKVIQLGIFMFNTLKEIGDYAFSNSSLTLIKYETKIEDNMYVPSGEGVEVFGEGAFQNLDVINLIIPKSLKTIKKDCFKGTYPTNVFYEGTKEEFENIIIESGNESILNTNIAYFSKEYKENCWYYDPDSLSTPKLY